MINYSKQNYNINILPYTVHSVIVISISFSGWISVIKWDSVIRIIYCLSVARELVPKKKNEFPDKWIPVQETNIKPEMGGQSAPPPRKG